MKFSKSTLIILTLAILGSSGCSMVTLGYNHADWILRYWITDYTSFNVQQKDLIHIEVDNYLRWHRNNALPEYIVFLQNINALINRNEALNAGEVMRARAESNRLYKKTMEPFIRPAAHVLSTLDKQQIEKLRNTLANKNRKQKEKTLFASAQDNLSKRAERHIDFVEQLVGDLSDEQAEKIREMSVLIPFATLSYIEQRETKQASLILLLNSNAGEEKIAALFRQWINAPEASRSPQQQQAIAAYEGAMNEMTARIFGLLTIHQKNRLSKKISSYIDDFQKLTLPRSEIPQPAN
ncbi:MAG: DUF6279 family lipoprotein [Gallionellaceae bacterium]|jgi:hypothetical protein